MFGSPKIRHPKMRRALLLSVGLLAVFVGGVLVLACVEKVRDVADRAT